MSGHSKWHTIKRKKGAVDAKRGKIFTKLIREIMTAARIGGGEIENNIRLRAAVLAARAANMPKDNIDRAIRRGTGDEEGTVFEEIAFEGYGPSGVALYIEVMTDNRNRTVGEIRHVLTKYGGNLGESGCVAYLFSKKGVVVVDGTRYGEDDVMAAALDAGAEDVQVDGTSIEVTCAPTDLETVRQALVNAGIEVESAQVSMIPATTVPLEGKAAQSMLRMMEALEDLDDVQHVYANFDISEDIMQEVTA